MVEATRLDRTPQRLEQLSTLRDTIETVFVGKRDKVEMALVALLSRGHLLIEDVPGVGKTILARTIARAVHCRFSRIQFTPDLLPSDITGVSIYDTAAAKFVFKPGPVFANIILADEVNRTTPRTQSALLEAMSDFQVSVDGLSHPLPSPFCVLATQNQYEFEGTYPLPESQLDRFMLRIDLGYPGRDDERSIILAQRDHHPIDDVRPVMEDGDVRALQQTVKTVKVDEAILEYMLLILDGTRNTEDIAMGASPRGGLHLYRACQALAVVKGRLYCTPDDVKQMAVPVLAHRIVCRSRGLGGTSTTASARAVQRVLDQIPVPM
jgi:MoxR-like ATPase